MTRENIRAHAAPYWIVVADSASAEFCRQAKSGSRVDKLFMLENSAVRKKSAALISDRGGRSFDSHGKGRHTMSNRHEPKEIQALQFARTVARRLVQIQSEEEVCGVVLIAAPRFLGMLRKAIDVTGGKGPYFTIDKDMVGHEERDIERIISENM